ncbi:MAG: DNA translocase FtsK [Erysipelotrichaceae bacterium]|nr:DNA translocase FtsK [Erysipelotrichaceae bacterium]
MPRKASTTKTRKTSKKVEEKKPEIKWGWIITVISSFVLLLFGVTKMGIMGSFFNNVLTYLFGSAYAVLLLTLFVCGSYILFSKDKKIPYKTGFGLAALCLLSFVLCSYIASDFGSFKEYQQFAKDYLSISKLWTTESLSLTGGIIGGAVYAAVCSMFTRTGVMVLIIALIICAMLLLVPMSFYQDLFSSTKEKTSEMMEEHKKRKEEARIAFEKEEEERRLRLAAEMNAIHSVDMSDKTEEAEEVTDFSDVEETVIEESVTKTVKIERDYNPEDILSNSPTWINLKDSEIYGEGSYTEPVNETKPDILVEVPIEDKPDKPKVLKRKTNSNYRLPKPVEEFLEPNTSKASSVNKTSAEMKGLKLIEILRSFEIEAELLNTYIGPSVTKFEIKPKGNVRINRIISISDNIKMELAARDIRIEAPIPGRSAVGIEIPNVEPIPVKMIDLMKKVPQDKKDTPLMFALGKDLMGESVYCNLARMPHLLIAGATGSGKSVCINTIITSLLFRTNPNDVRLVLVDPKKVEFTPYKDIPHLLWPIIDDSTMASNMLKKIVVIMEERYDLFATCGVRNIDTYNSMVIDNNQNPENEPMEKLPYIVVIIDELADLMAVAKKDVELSIQRITQLARASGIHLIVATQRPSTDVITGLIKSNIPSRISFAVASSIDSRTILDTIGAERLLGNGDMLYYPQGENSPRRLQGVYVTDSEIRKITTYVKSQAKPEYEDSYFEFLTNMNGTTVMSNDGPAGADSQDSLYDEVVEFVRDQQRASTSLLQRRFGIGYNRAARLIDTLEDRGIIGPANGSKPREVYIKEEDEQ